MTLMKSFICFRPKLTHSCLTYSMVLCYSLITELSTNMPLMMVRHTAELPEPNLRIPLDPTPKPSEESTARSVMFIDPTRLVRRSRRFAAIHRLFVRWRRNSPPLVPSTGINRDERSIPARSKRLSPQGLGVGVDCKKHQIYITLDVHPEPHYYWVYMFPVQGQKHEVMERLKTSVSCTVH